MENKINKKAIEVANKIIRESKKNPDEKFYFDDYLTDSVNLNDLSNAVYYIILDNILDFDFKIGVHIAFVESDYEEENSEDI